MAGRYGRGRFVGPDLSVGGVTPPPGPSCAITLTHDGLGAFGLAPMSVTGQTVSVTGDGTSMYGMSAGLSGVSVDWTGVRVVAKKYIDIPATPGNGLIHLARASGLIAARLFWNDGDGQWNAEITALATDTRLTFTRPLGGIEAEPAIGIDGATGDCVMFLDGAPVVDKNTPNFAQLGGLFASDSAIILDVAAEVALGDTYSAEIITQSDKYTTTYPAGTLDWCGNALPEPPLPSMVAGYYINTLGEQVVEVWGYSNSQEVGSLTGIPLQGQTIQSLYVAAIDGSVTSRAAEFPGDATTALAGKSLYLDGVEYPITSVTYYAVTDYTEALIPTLPTFTEGVTYTVEFK